MGDGWEAQRRHTHSALKELTRQGNKDAKVYKSRQTRPERFGTLSPNRDERFAR